MIALLGRPISARHDRPARRTHAAIFAGRGYRDGSSYVTPRNVMREPAIEILQRVLPLLK